MTAQSFLLYVRHKFRDMMKSQVEREAKSSNSEENELEEAASERSLVDALIKPVLEDPATSNGTDVTSVAASPVLLHQVLSGVLPPVLTHRLRKVFSSSRKSPPKVALVSLDLHVPVRSSSANITFKSPFLTALLCLSVAKFWAY
jgi:hypothetical protein